jgi:hypothetical protein
MVPVSSLVVKSCRDQPKNRLRRQTRKTSKEIVREKKDLCHTKNLYFVRGEVMLRASQSYAVAALLCHLASE